MDSVVVVGGGLAGARVCAELRGQGYPGRVTLVAAERHPPYDRPPLSKELLAGRTDDSTLDLAWEDLDVDLRLATTATQLEPGRQKGSGRPEPGRPEPGRLLTTRGPIRYDACVLATGASPLRLPGSDGVHLLRTVDNARVLRAELIEAEHAVVVGAGWIGAEVATAAAGHGCAVTVLEAGPTPAAPLGRTVGALTVPWYARAGITLRCDTPVLSLAGPMVTVAGGERLRADVVAVGIGVRPAVEWLAGSGLELDDGVVTDAAGRTSLPGVWAVGDCARRWSPRAGRYVRTEHWDDALHAPTALVTALLGGDAAYDPVPYFWSEQLGHHVQWVGWREGEPDLFRGDPAADGGWAAAWLGPTGRLRGFLAVDRPRDLLQARRAIDRGARPDPHRLADPAVAVRDA